MSRNLMAVVAGMFILGITSLANADFVGNKDSQTFHTEQCPLVKQMKDANKVAFKTAAEAVKAGYTACKKCNPVDAPEVVFVGSKDSQKYHKLDCRIAAKIKPDNLVKFASKKEAEKAGYKPCAICLPSNKKADDKKADKEDKK